MAVPRALSLRPGIAVNIVLKQDQRSGKLTTGKIKDLLTRGDHPRGIKVRLEDGQIGRVQSLIVNDNSIASEMAATPSTSQSLQAFKFQEDVRNQCQPPPSAEASLGDYIKIKSTKKGKNKKDLQPSSGQPAPSRIEDSQHSLEKEFPSLDSSLVAAILSDSEDVDAARCILQTLVESGG